MSVPSATVRWVAVLPLLLVTACSAGSAPQPPVLVLLQNGAVFEVTLDGTAKAVQQTDMRSAAFAGSYAAFEARSHSLLIPVNIPEPRIDQLQISSKSVRQWKNVSGSFTYLRGIRVGRVTGRVFAFGLDSEGSRIEVFSAVGELQSTIRFPGLSSNPRSDVIYQTLLADDESIVGMTYHASDLNGLDVARASGGEWISCSGPHPCFGGHGGAATLADGSIAMTTGSTELLRYPTAQGGNADVKDTGLDGNHLMVLTRTGDLEVAVLGGCEYAGGLSIVHFDSGAVSGIAPPVIRLGAATTDARVQICGDTISPYDGNSKFVIGSNRSTLPDNTASYLKFVSLPGARIMGSAKFDVSIADVMVER